jgi:hypothetical protein
MFLKLIILAAAIGIAWYGFKFVGRLEEQRKERLARRAGEDSKTVTDTMKCPSCGAYVNAAAPSDCGQSGCPY